MGFMPKKSTIDAIFVIQKMMKKFEVARRKLYMVFVNFVKIFDRVPREDAW